MNRAVVQEPESKPVSEGYLPAAVRLLVSFWDENSADALWRAVFWVTLAAIPILTCIAGPWIQAVFGHDSVMLLDGGWRVVNGQRPHLDFSTGLGPVTPLLIAAGLLVSGGTANALAYVEAFIFFAIGLWAYQIASRGMPPLQRTLCALLLAFLAGAAHPIAMGVSQISYAMMYNRIGYALLAIVILAVWLRPGAWAGDISVGVALGVLAFLKMNYFGAGILLIATGILAGRIRWLQLIRISAALACLNLFFWIYLHGNALAVVEDLRMVAAARLDVVSLTIVRSVVSITLRDFGIALLLLLLMAPRVHRRSGALSDIQLILLCVSVYAADTMVNLTNQQAGAAPLLAVLALILLDQGRWESNAGIPGAVMPRAAALAAAMVFLIGPLLGRDAASILIASIKTSLSNNVTRFASRNLASLRLAQEGFYFGGSSNTVDRESARGPIYTLKTNDGIELLKRYTHDSDPVLCFELFNPFNFALGRPAPRGDSLWWAYNYSFSDRAYLPADRVFRTATAVMVPKRSTLPDTTVVLMRLYGDMLNRNFHITAESAEWTLYMKNGA